MNPSSDQVFSDQSDVSVVLTSCGRFDLLKKTIDSFLRFNTYPVKSFIITEDSGDPAVYECVPERLRRQFTFLINQPRLGQIKSIDLAYSKVTTPYIFHCEDDWEFYRQEFIEDSKAILQSNEAILQVWLRSYFHDIAIHSPYHHLDNPQEVSGVRFFRVLSDKKDWQGFSFNPGLRRLSDYREIGTYGSYPSEKQLSLFYAEKNMWAAILENDAVAHTGFGEHVEDVREVKKKKRKKRRDRSRTIVIVLIASILSFFLGRLS